jgi:FkbM family methyltransferase
VTRPTEYPLLRFSSPTHALQIEMRRGPDREIETRQWIDGIPGDSTSVLWDVGAQVGSFSVYAASRGITVVSVEPVPQNLMMLTRNIDLNNVHHLCTVLPVAACSKDGPEMLCLSGLGFGSARNNFGGATPSHGGELSGSAASFRVVGTTIRTAVRVWNLPPPQFLKVDVDGLDDDVVYGCGELLSSIRSICCELRFSAARVEALSAYLHDYGLVLTHRSHRNGFWSRS